MTAAARQVLREAMGLTPNERAELIDALLRSFDPKADDGIADAWRPRWVGELDFATLDGGDWSYAGERSLRVHQALEAYKNSPLPVGEGWG